MIALWDEDPKSCTGHYISACVEYLHCVGCPSDVVTWFLTMSELVEWVESFCTLGNETMIIADESNIASEIGFWGGCGKSGTA